VSLKLLVSPAKASLADFSFHVIRCLDPALAMAPVFEKFSSVVITSGTISPLEMCEYSTCLLHSSSASLS